VREKLDVIWLEEPLHSYDDVEALRKLKLNIRIPPQWSVALSSAVAGSVHCLEPVS
jgi:L-alanine-DL-glutamate epimerase-like enolase superfamily enzyme